MAGPGPVAVAIHPSVYTAGTEHIDGDVVLSHFFGNAQEGSV
jgi:hypothetical protein